MEGKEGPDDKSGNVTGSAEKLKRIGNRAAEFYVTSVLENVQSTRFEILALNENLKEMSICEKTAEHYLCVKLLHGMD